MSELYFRVNELCLIKDIHLFRRAPSNKSRKNDRVGKSSWYNEIEADEELLTKE